MEGFDQLMKEMEEEGLPLKQLVKPTSLRLLEEADVGRVGRSPDFDYSTLVQLMWSEEQSREEQDRIFASKPIRSLIKASNPTSRMQFLVAHLDDLLQNHGGIQVEMSFAAWVNDHPGRELASARPEEIFGSAHSQSVPEDTWVRFVQPLPFLVKRILIHILFRDMLGDFEHQLTREARETDPFVRMHTCKRYHKDLILPLLQNATAEEIMQLKVDSIRTVPNWPDLASLPGSGGQLFDVDRGYLGFPDKQFNPAQNASFRAKWGIDLSRPMKDDIIEMHVRKHWDGPLQSLVESKLHTRPTDLEDQSEKRQRREPRIRLDIYASGEARRSTEGEGDLEFSSLLAASMILNWQGHTGLCNKRLVENHDLILPGTRNFHCMCDKIRITASIV